MSYVVQQLQNWLISWLFNWFNMVSVRFLGTSHVLARCPWCFLNKYKTIRLEKTAQHWETKGKFSFATNPMSPTNFQETYFPCSLDSALQILNRGREQAYETRSGASLRQSRSWISRPMRCSWKGCPAIVASSGGPRNPTPWAFPPLFVDLEGSRRLGFRWIPIKPRCLLTKVLEVTARHVFTVFKTEILVDSDRFPPRFCSRQCRRRAGRSENTTSTLWSAFS